MGCSCKKNSVPPVVKKIPTVVAPTPQPKSQQGSQSPSK